MTRQNNVHDQLSRLCAITVVFKCKGFEKRCMLKAYFIINVSQLLQVHKKYRKIYSTC